MIEVATGSPPPESRYDVPVDLPITRFFCHFFLWLRRMGGKKGALVVATVFRGLTSRVLAESTGS